MSRATFKMPGRIYQSPFKKKEIYFNLGYGGKNAQTYADYEPWLAEHGLSEEEYNKIVRRVKRIFDEHGFDEREHNFDVWCTCCIFSAGICFPCCLLIKLAAKKLEKKLTRTVPKLHDKFQIRYIEDERLRSEPWWDSKGKPLYADFGPLGVRQAGPPIAISMVMTTDEPAKWPPEGVELEEVPPVKKPTQEEMRAVVYCGSCGKRSSPYSHFCGKCGVKFAST
mmetsp:Transcript_75736/g.169575  ORF Transcript_75736/g.169575 Transcript_75736/m.169575 type:complete len:224 (-) Transcript_75736:303-974(-)